MQEDLSEGGPVSWLAVPVNSLNKCFVRKVFIAFEAPWL